MNAKTEKPNCSDDIIRKAQLVVEKSLRKQQLEIERADMALSFLEEMESNKLEKDLLLDGPYEFRGLQALREEINQYTALVQHVIDLTKPRRSNYSKHEYVPDNFVEKARDDCNIRNGFNYHDTPTSTVPSQNLTDSRMSCPAVTSDTTMRISPEITDAVPKYNSDSFSLIKPKEVLNARKSVQTASEPDDPSLQLIQPTNTANQKSHPFLSQASSDSHSLHAAMQNVLGSLKRTLPGFHQIASNILNSDVVDFISAFSVALRRYDDRIRSQIELLLEEYDSLPNSLKRSELVCEIDHLYKISRSARVKRKQLLLLNHASYKQSANCPPIRQLRILYSTFS